MTVTTRFLTGLLVLGCLFSAGCFSRLHMTNSYGRANRQAFQRQTVNPGAGATAKTPKGLDAQEASVVVDSYRTQLAPQGGSNPNTNQMILLSPNTGAPGYSSGAPAAAPK